MRAMKRLMVLLALLAATSSPLRAQNAGGRILPALAGGVFGVAGGGYVALSVVVAQARGGNYLHDFQEMFGWRSLPVIAGGALGAGLGIYSPDRLRRAIIWGYGGWAVGGLLGAGIGKLVWAPPEGKWAGFAIGAGAGLVAAYLAGALTAPSGGDIGNAQATEVPIMIRIPVR